MSRRLAGLLAVLFAPVALAQDLPPPHPSDLARGLRESGQADLALEYLAELGAKAPADVQKVLPLERAKCRLELAGSESDDTLRAALVAEAKKEFDAFVKGNAGHPRLPEAAVALAQLQTLEGKTQVQRANRLPADQRAGELAKARPLFVSAGKQYASAGDALKKLADAEEAGGPRHKELTQNYLQALLDQGTNFYLLATSYGESPAGKELDEKVKAAKDAAAIFTGLWQRYKDTPHGWAARAWAAECLREQFEPKKAEDGLKATLDEGLKAKTPASAAGVRQARYFLVREDFDKNGKVDSPTNDRQRVRNACRDWLKEYAAGRPTPEVYAIRYYLGRVCMNEALKRENVTVEQVKPKDPKEKPTERIIGVKEAGLNLLREADAQFKILVRTENEYTERATRQRPAALRWLVGNPDRPPRQFATFDEAYMAALVQMEEARTLAAAGDEPAQVAAAAKERAATLNKAIALLERADTLPVPPESARDAARADLDLARLYVAAGRPYAAAVYAEHAARSARSPTAAAKAAIIALDAYGRTARTTAPDFEDGRGVDRDRRVALAQYMVKTAPNEPETDSARMMLGGDLYRMGRKADAFAAFAGVPARYPRLAQARLFEGVSAFDLVRPLNPDETRPEELPADRKAAIFRQAVADLTAVPQPPDAVKDDPEGESTPVTDYFNLRLQLAQLHITQGAAAYPTAEALLVAGGQAAGKHPGLSADDKVKFAMRYESLRIRAVYGQAMPLYAQGKYAEAAERFSGLLNEVLPGGRAVKDGQPADVGDLAKGLDADRIRLLIVPTLNAYVRAGSAAKTAELLDALKKFGGDVSTSARVVQQGVASIRPVVDALRRDGKGEDADKLVAAVVGMVTKLAAEPNLPADVRLNLGKSFRELGENGKAADLLLAVTGPTNKEAFKGELKAVENETAEQTKQREADNAAAPQYRQARVELARAYRLDKKYAEAAAVLDDALGKEADAKTPQGVRPRAGGWASRYPEYRKEAILLIEAKAAAAPDNKTAVPLWNEASANWRGWAAEYVNALNQLNQKYVPKKRDFETLDLRRRHLEELAAKEKVDFDEEKAATTKALEQAEREVTTADDELKATLKGLEAANEPADVEKAKAAVEAARDAVEGTTLKVTELKARLPLLAELAGKKDLDLAAEAAAAQKLVEPVQKEVGVMTRQMNPLKSVWQDVLAEQYRCLLAAMTAFHKADPAKLAEFATKHARTISDFEKGNRPLPVNVKQKLFDLIESNPTLKAEYRKAGGIDMLAPPGGNP